MSTSFRPVNSSKLRQSLSVEAHDEGVDKKSLPSKRRASMPYQKSADPNLSDDEEDPKPSINKSVLRASTGNQGLKISMRSKTPSSKRQKISTNGQYVPKQVNGSSGKSHHNPSLIVSLKYRSHTPSHNKPPTYQDSEVCVSGTGWLGQLATTMRKTHKGVPVRVDAFDPLDGFSIAQIACGPTHCAALTSDGTIVTWGSNVLGALGRDTGREDNEGPWEYNLEQLYVRESENVQANKDPQIDLESEPEEIDMKTFFDGVSVVQVAVGCHKTFALTSDGYVYAWGAFVNRFRWDGKDVSADLTIHKEPTLMITKQNVTAIAAGNDFLLVLTDTHEVDRFGVFTFDAQVGPIDWFSSRNWPDTFNSSTNKSTLSSSTSSKRPPRIVKIFTTPMAAFAITRKGDLLAWGDNGSNRLALPKANIRSSPTPQKISGLPKGIKIRQVVGSANITMAVLADGSAYIWGALDSAFPSATSSTLPPEIKIRKENVTNSPEEVIYEPCKLAFEDVAAAAVGDEHIILMTRAGELFAWGSNKSGQCGLGWSRQSLSTPYELKIKPLGGRPVSWIAAASTWTFFGAAIEGAGSHVTKLQPKVGEAMDLD